MSQLQSLEHLVNTYQSLTQTLAEQKSLNPTDVLNCLLTRDKIAHLIGKQEANKANFVVAIAQGDLQLKDLLEAISQLEEIPIWRASLTPPTESWWWYPTAPESELTLGIFERYDWIWNTLNIAVLTIIFALVVDISPRFYQAGADTAGAFAIVIQSVLAMLTAGGILTKTGAEAIKRIFRSLNIPKLYWQEIRFGLAVFLLISLIAFRTYGLSWIAQWYHQQGNDFFEQGQLIQAQLDYQRALKINANPNSPRVLIIHHDMGRLYEDLQDFGKARSEYQIAVQGHYIPSYNRLARLKILVDKKYDEAIFLLLNGLKLAQDEGAFLGEQTDSLLLIYQMQKNLGWARLEQKRYREAKAELELAIGLKQDQAQAHCLLAQVLDELAKEKGEDFSLEGLREWELCSQFASRLKPEEDRWIYQAQQAQLRFQTSQISATLSLSDTQNTTQANLSNNSLNDAAGFHLLISTQNTVNLKRSQWAGYHNTNIGVKLYHGDQLLPAEDAQAIVLCNDLSTWSVPGGVPSGLSNGCALSSQPILTYSQTISPLTQIETRSSVPYIISPRASHILSITPTLRWHQVADVLSYTVIISGTGINWQTVTTQNSILYNGPPLTRGQNYSFIVKTEAGVLSHQANRVDLQFTVLADDKAEAVYKQISNLALSGQAKLLAISHLYLTHNLKAEAIETLLILSAIEKQTPAIHHTLGRLYYESALLELAEEHYQEALTLAQEAENIERLATIQFDLAQVYILLKQNTVAIDTLKQAQSNYEILGDLPHITQIQTQLCHLRPATC